MPNCVMTALPTTPKFIEYEKVYLPKNRFIKAETMDTEDYLSHFYPFERPRFKKKGIESSWEINDPTMAALFLTFQNRLQSQVMTFQRTYGERYDWLKLQFTDWTLIAMTCFFYYEDRDNIDPVQREVYRKALEGFDSTAPGFHYALTDERPVLVWDFHSLSLTLQMLLSEKLKAQVPIPPNLVAPGIQQRRAGIIKGMGKIGLIHSGLLSRSNEDS